MPDGQVRLTLESNAQVDKNGKFYAILISEGEGNGYKFSADVLKESADVFEGIECFVDHSLWGHSVRDLGGVFSNAAWDEDESGLGADLHTKGPSGSIVAEMGQEMLGEGPKPDVGFSADVLLKVGSGKEVLKILRAYSVDLVVNPARGGKFIKSLNAVQARFSPEEDVPMPKKVDVVEEKGKSKLEEQLKEDEAAVEELLSFQEQRKELSEESAKMRELRKAGCANLLTMELNAAKLPAAAEKRVRKQFEGRVFEPAELTDAIDDARELVAELQGGAVVQGVPGGVGQMFSQEDQLRAAVQDLFQVERDDDLAQLQVPRLTGIRELYTGMTGDLEFRGGIFPERVRFNTGDFNNLVADVMNKVMVSKWDQLGKAGYNWWEKIVHTEQTKDLKEVEWTIFGTIASLPEVAKGDEYEPLMIGDSVEKSAYTKYGGYVGIDLEDLINDDTRKLRQTPRELAAAGIRNISALVAAIFTANSGVGPTLEDTGALFNATAVTSAGGHNNLLTTAIGSDYTAWDAIAQAMYDQPMLVANKAGYYGTGKKVALNPPYCLVPRALQAAAQALFIPRWNANVESIPSEGGPTYAGVVEPITVPEWTDSNNYAAVQDPDLMPGIGIAHVFGLKPEIFVAGNELDPAVFMNDESRIKVRHWVAVGVIDFRALHKSNVA
jgi:hypothetical protein